MAASPDLDLILPTHGSANPSSGAFGTSPDVDTDFCAICGHDWCSVRISKENVEFASGKAPGFERERVLRSPGLTPEARETLVARGVLPPDVIHQLANRARSVVGADCGKAACHSDLAGDERAEKILFTRLDSQLAA